MAESSVARLSSLVRKRTVAMSAPRSSLRAAPGSFACEWPGPTGPAGGRCRRRGRPVRTRTAAHRAIGKRAGACAFSTSSTRHHHHGSMNTGRAIGSGPATESATGSPGPSPVPPPLRRRFTESPVLCPRNFRPESARPNAAKPARLTHEASVTGQAREGATPWPGRASRLG
jgi:hypothetical protein